MLDRDMRYLAVSRRWMKDFGLSESIVGRSHYEVFPEIPPEWRESHQRCLRGETEVSTNDHLQLADGRSFWLKRDVRPWRDNQGKIGGLVVSWEDITGRKQAEEQQQMLMREVMHRTKNLIAVIQSIATATFRQIAMTPPKRLSFRAFMPWRTPMACCLTRRGKARCWMISCAGSWQVLQERSRLMVRASS